MNPDRFTNKNLAKWLMISAAMTGLLYLIFFLFLFYNRQNITIPAPPDSVRLETPTIAPTATPTVLPSPTPTTAKKKFCGGIAGRQCPTGYTCKLSGNYPDAGGTCLLKNN